MLPRILTGWLSRSKKTITSNWLKHGHRKTGHRRIATNPHVCGWHHVYLTADRKFEPLVALFDDEWSKKFKLSVCR